MKDDLETVKAEELRARLGEAVENREWEFLRQALTDLHPADIADLIENAPAKERAPLFELLDDETQADVLAELDDSVEEDLLAELTPKEISAIVEEMAPDDAADMLGELDDQRSESVLNLMNEEDSREVRELLAYPEDSAGGIMTTDFVALPGHTTAQEALEHIGSLELDEPLHFTYVVDERQRLLGYVQIWKMLKKGNRRRRLHDLVETEIFSVRTDTDQEDVARMMSKYDLSSIPVLDAAGRMAGRITVDDIFDVMEEEASEDIFKLAGSSDDELDYRSPLAAGRARLPWLLITLATGLLTSLILKSFMRSVSTMEILALSFFVPIVMAMGGNTGIQSSTLIVRGLAVGRFSGRKLYRVFLREIATGALMGGICGLAIGLWAHFVIGATTAYPPAFLALSVGLALFSAMVFAASFGSLAPLLLNRLGFDPAIAAGPFVSASNDITALLIYYGIILAMIGAVAP
jgi:magnesium transporter